MKFYDKDKSTDRKEVSSDLFDGLDSEQIEMLKNMAKMMKKK